VNSVYTTPLRSLKRGLLEALGRIQAGWHDVPSRKSGRVVSAHAIRLRHLELVRLRGVEICIGLHARAAERRGDVCDFGKHVLAERNRCAVSQAVGNCDDGETLSRSAARGAGAARGDCGR
jgi:hypothetical protein